MEFIIDFIGNQWWKRNLPALQTGVIVNVDMAESNVTIPKLLIFNSYPGWRQDHDNDFNARFYSCQKLNPCHRLEITFDARQ